VSDPLDLEKLLAAEEHRQGLPYLADPGHCVDCAAVDLAWHQAVCQHDDDYQDLVTLGSPVVTRLCNQCGAITEVAR
jgi:hypothetical protein